MKTNYYPLLIVLTAFLLILNIYQYKCAMSFLSPEEVIQIVTPTEEKPLFIWNDDHESIPVDGTPILLEFSSINHDTIYIGPLEGSFKGALK